jgi:chromate transporter
VFAPTPATSTAAAPARLPAVVDDDTPPPPHARFSRRRLARVLATGALLWALPMALLWTLCGPAHPFTRMALFFTQAALVTFGGAYAVLPYVWQGAVVEQRWLAPSQMVDGLALGETTPGPLIMVVAFVAFVGGWTTAPFGADRTAAAGIVAALLVTWFTFLPSFVFVLGGGPFVEGTRDTRALAGPLAAITAAVVGVIANLAGFFAWHTLWPQGLAGAFDTFAFVLAIVATLALTRARRSTIEVIGVCAVAGIAWAVAGGAR